MYRSRQNPWLFASILPLYRTTCSTVAKFRTISRYVSQFDNYQGHWGKQEKLDQFLQAYAVEKVKIEARRQGHSVAEQWLDDGQVKLTVQVGGAA